MSRHKERFGITWLWQEFDEVMDRVQAQVGFTLHRKQSTLRHPEAGMGVFVNTRQVLLPGTVLGFVPGVIATKSGNAKPKQTEIPERGELPHILRFDDTAINFEDNIVYPWNATGKTVLEVMELYTNYSNSSPLEAPGEAINPFAVGHHINHPAEGHPANVCFLEMEVPAAFFPKFLMRFFPYMHFSYQEFSLTPLVKRSYKVIVVVALEALENGEELFVNYGYVIYSTERFAETFTPEWLHSPPDNNPIAQFLVKKDCLYDFSRMNKLLGRWDIAAGTTVESIIREREEKQRLSAEKALANPQLFKEYYQHKDSRK